MANPLDSARQYLYMAYTGIQKEPLQAAIRDYNDPEKNKNLEKREKLTLIAKATILDTDSEKETKIERIVTYFENKTHLDKLLNKILTNQFKSSHRKVTAELEETTLKTQGTPEDLIESLSLLASAVFIDENHPPKLSPENSEVSEDMALLNSRASQIMANSTVTQSTAQQTSPKVASNENLASPVIHELTQEVSKQAENTSEPISATINPETPAPTTAQTQESVNGTANTATSSPEQLASKQDESSPIHVSTAPSSPNKEATTTQSPFPGETNVSVPNKQGESTQTSTVDASTTQAQKSADKVASQENSSPKEEPKVSSPEKQASDTPKADVKAEPKVEKKHYTQEFENAAKKAGMSPEDYEAYLEMIMAEEGNLEPEVVDEVVDEPEVKVPLKMSNFYHPFFSSEDANFEKAVQASLALAKIDENKMAKTGSSTVTVKEIVMPKQALQVEREVTFEERRPSAFRRCVRALVFPFVALWRAFASCCRYFRRREPTENIPSTEKVQTIV